MAKSRKSKSNRKPKSAPEPIAEGEDAPSDISDEDTSVPEPNEDAPVSPEADESDKDVSPEADGPPNVPNPSAPEGMATTFDVAEPVPEPSDTPVIPHEGKAAQYMILRVANRGWVIEEKWQNLPTFEAIEEVIESEVAAGRSGSLHRGNRTVATWGTQGPARI